MSVKFFWNKICPFVQRAWIVAVEKSIPLEFVYVPLDVEAPDWYKAINPRETVPAAQLVDGTVVLESMFVAKYFDEAYEPKNSLMTEDPLSRARINAFISGLEPFIRSCYGLLFADEANVADAKVQVTATTRALEAKITTMSAGPFAMGVEFTMADAALVPFLDRFRYTLRGYRNYDLFDGAPRLRALLEAAFLRRSVWSTALTQLEYLEAYAGENRPLIVPPKWVVTCRKGAPSSTAIKVLLEWLGKAKDYVDVQTNDTAEATVLQLPNGESFTDPATPPVVVLEYLAEQFKALQPPSAVDRSKGRLIMDFAAYLKGDDVDDVVVADAHIANVIVGPFVFGNEPSLYDAVIASVVAAALQNDKTASSIGPKLRAHFDNVRSTPTVAAHF